MDPYPETYAMSHFSDFDVMYLTFILAGFGLFMLTLLVESILTNRRK